MVPGKFLKELYNSSMSSIYDSTAEITEEDEASHIYLGYAARLEVIV